jgi:hypothetical protein
MQALRRSWLNEAAFTTPAFADDFDLIDASTEDIAARDDDAWADIPLPVSVTLPIDSDMACEVVIPAHYEPRYSYPLLIWIQPDERASFRERISAISDRNYVGVSLHWSGFLESPRGAIPRVAECHGHIQSALWLIGTLWNTHPGRRYLIAEGAAACNWARRLTQHAPNDVDALVCMGPEPWTALIRDTISLPMPHKRLLLISDEIDVIDTWRQRPAVQGWAIESALPNQQDGQMARRINAWLMSRVAGE